MLGHWKSPVFNGIDIDFNNEISMKSHIYAFTFGDKDNKILSNM